MGKPVITNSGWGDVDTIIPHSISGVLVRELTTKGYQKAISELSNTNFNAAHIRSSAEAYFSLQKGVEKYAEIYRQLTSNQ